MRSLLVTCACLLLVAAAIAQGDAVSAPAHKSLAKTSSSPPIPLSSLSTTNVPSEIGGAFMFPAMCDEDGNLYIRKLATDRPMLGPVVKIDPDSRSEEHTAELQSPCNLVCRLLLE